LKPRRFQGRRFQHFGETWQGAPGRGSTRSDGFLGSVESVPGERLYVGAKNEIGVAFPGLKLMLLGGTDGAGNDLKDVGWRAAVQVLDSDGDTENVGGAKQARRARRNGSDEAAVGKAPRADLERSEEAGESATGTNGVHEMALGEDDWLAGGEVSCDDRERNTQVFELSGMKDTRN
jgi:hypothetical protein